MKLSYFYLLYFLVSINWSFCYESISNGKELHRLGPAKRSSKSGNGRHKHLRRRMVAQEYEEDKDLVASLDIGNFIEQPDPDYERIIEDPRYEQNRRRPSKYNYELSSLNDLESYLDIKSKETLNNKLDTSKCGSGRRQATEGRQYLISYDKFPDLTNNEEENTLDDDTVAAKESSFKKTRRRQAVPFFSHDVKKKRHKKRKFFNFRSKTTSSTTTLLPKFDGTKQNTKTNVGKIFKRSTFQFCPLCKRKMVPKKKDKQTSSSRKYQDIIHNSRQYYQSLSKQKNGSNNDLPNSDIDRGVGVSDKDVRIKRSSEETRKEYSYSEKPSLSDSYKQRQLHELDELEKNVDGVEIGGMPESFKQKAIKVLF